MSSAAITTLIKMMETLPERAQGQVVEHLRDYIADMQDEEQWASVFQRTQKELIAAARRAKQEIAAGKSEPMDDSRL
jgi:translation initiation factor 2B subunit (eIF-2B alpha/beta/delta family)